MVRGAVVRGVIARGAVVRDVMVTREGGGIWKRREDVVGIEREGRGAKERIEFKRADVYGCHRCSQGRV